MMIAMKFYFSVSLFFLSFCLPFSGFTQAEPHSEQIQTVPADPIEDLKIDEHFNPRAMPDHWLDQPEKESDTFQTKFFNMLTILGLLIGFMILASWALKRLMKTKLTHMNTTGHIKVLETRYLSPRATLYLVEIQDQAFLIAESPTNVAYLTNFSLEKETSS